MNLGVITGVLGLLLLGWFLTWINDKAKKTSYEPLANNFVIRFCLLMFLEFALCSLINLNQVFGEGFTVG